MLQENVILQEALQQSFNDGMVQPGIVVIGTHRFIKIDQLAIKIQTGCMAESIALLFASYYVFNLTFDDSLSMIYSFLVAMMEINNDSTSQKKKKVSRSVVLNNAVNKIFADL